MLIRNQNVGVTFFGYDLQAATFGQGVDVIVEMLANVNLGRDLQMLKRNGRIGVRIYFHS